MNLDNYKLQKIAYSCGILEQLKNCELGASTGKENLNTLAVGMCVVRLWETCKSIIDAPTWNEVMVLNQRFPEVPWEALRKCAIRVIHPTEFERPWEVLAEFYKEVFPKVTQWYISRAHLEKSEFTDVFSKL